MGKDLRSLVRSLVMSPTEAYREACWQPAMDIYRGHFSWLVKLDLAGVRPEDIELRTEGRRLVIRGVRRDLSILEGQQAYSMEISYNRFERSIELPCDLQNVDIRCEYRDGMYLVTIHQEACRDE
jgi:HSP20 family protein